MTTFCLFQSSVFEKFLCVLERLCGIWAVVARSTVPTTVKDATTEGRGP